MQRTDCYQTLQGSAKKLVSATGLAGKLDHIGVGAYSTLAGEDIFAQDYV